MIAVQSVPNADYCLLYRNEGSRRKYFNELERETEPKKKDTPDPASFQKLQQPLKNGNYDGIALIKDGMVIEHLPGGRPAPPAASASAHTTSTTSGSAPVARADGGPVARFTRLEHTQVIGKQFYLLNDKLTAHTSSSSADAKAHIVSCATIEDLEAAFRSATPHDIFVGGLPQSDGVSVTTKAKRSESKIARSKDDFSFRAAPGVMFVDNDHPVGEGDDQFFAYIEAVPALASASYVYSPSSSAYIVSEESGEILRGPGGQHYAIPVQDASDIPRALVALHKRLILADHGKAVVSNAGTVLFRSPADEALKSPNQPLFQRTTVGPGLRQQKESHIGSHRGQQFLFDTRLIEDLSADELVRLKEIQEGLRVGVGDEVRAKRGDWIEARVQHVAEANSVGRDIAVAGLRAMLTAGAPKAQYDLMPGIQVMFGAGLGRVDVSDLLANPNRYDGKPCADPLEPDYGAGVGVAKFFANSGSGKPTINSLAHGGQVFFLHNDLKDLDGLIQNLRLEVTGAGEVNRSPLHDVFAPAPAGEPGTPQQPSQWTPQWTPPLPPPQRLFQPIGELMRNRKPKRFLVRKLIEEQTMVMVFGAPKIGKSFVTLDWAACIATGQPWMGREVRQGAVFYLAGEGHAGIVRRMRAWVVETGIDLSDKPLFVSRLPSTLMNKDSANEVEREVSEMAAESGISPAVLVIDTLARNLGAGDDSSNEDMGVFINHIDGIRLRLGITIVIVHHSGVMEKDRYRGASALGGGVDEVFMVGGSDGTPHRCLKHQLSKDQEPAETINFSIKSVELGEGWETVDGEPDKSAVIVPDDESRPKEPKAKRLTDTQRGAMQALVAAIARHPEPYREDGWIGVHRDDWRIEFNRTYTAASQEAKKKAFQRVSRGLHDDGLVRLEFDNYLIHDTDERLVAAELVKRMTKEGHGT